jgi:hypothetical protein
MRLRGKSGRKMEEEKREGQLEGGRVRGGREEERRQ